MKDEFWQLKLVSLILLALFVGISCSEPEEETPLNVLFIAIDDLRPQLGAYGENIMVTPHLDQLAAESRLFERHYVQVPTCGASRYAMLTGLRPTTPDHLSNQAIRILLPREELPRPESFVHLFRRNGYHTTAIGKIGHYVDGRLYSYEGEGDGAPEMPFSWDEHLMPYEKWGTAWNSFFAYADGSNRNMNRGHYPAYERVDVPDTAYPDGLIAETAIQKLDDLQDEPFFLGVGFFKPHLPFTAPEKYWALYDPDSLDVSPNPEAPVGINSNSLHPSNEMFASYAHPHRGKANDKILRHAYYASVSYVDAQVGKVLDELDRLGLREKTIVVVWGDHGWHLGDQTIWGKHTTFERALRSALIVQVPGMKNPGQPTQGIVETLDLYPTLAELAGLDAPTDLTGTSFVPLLNDPSLPGKNGAFGYWRGRSTLRTDRYRLVVYEDSTEIPRIELFDHETDPFETKNVASMHPERVAKLMRQWLQLPTKAVSSP